MTIFSGQPMADVDNNGVWRDHLMVLPIPSGVQILAGDTLNFRMYAHNATGKISLGFTDGSNSDWYCGQCTRR